MKKSILILSIAILHVLSLHLHNAAAQVQVDTDKMDLYFNTLFENNRFIGSVTILSGDEVVFNKAYGKADESGVPVSPESIYRIGSIAKTYTAVMIMQLIEQGEITLDTRLAEFFPELPNADKITIEQLLRHKSGLYNFTNLPEYMEYYTEPKTREELIEIFIEAGTSFDAGEGTEYSNTAFVTLGFIIEDVTGKPFAEAFEGMIAEPLGLKRTYVGDGIDTSTGEVESFKYTEGNWQLQPQTDMSIPGAAGAVVANSYETAYFFRALFDGKLLSNESLAKMQTFDGPFGLGLIQFPFNEKTAYGHNGGIDGFLSTAAIFTDQDITFSVLANGVNYNFNNILVGLLSITFGEEFEIPEFVDREPITLSGEELKLYSGTYSSAQFPLDITVFHEDGKLKAQATGQGAFELTILDHQTMTVEAAGIEMVFEEKEDGRYKAFNFSQGGLSLRFTLEEE